MASEGLNNIILTDAERDKLAEILAEIQKGKSDKYKELMMTYYEEVPVTIDKFISDPLYLGKSTNNGEGIYPYWKNALKEILHGGKSYTEVIFSGAIGLGKSYVGCIIGAYLLYKLLCLKSPQSYYNLGADSNIVFAFFNIYKYVSEDVAYGQFQRMLMNSPWFLKHGEIRGVKNREYYPNKGISFMVGCNEDHAIGKNIYFGLLDEMSFAKKANADILKSGIMKLYRSVKTRMISRFTREGILQAKMILISSKRTDSDFLDQYAQKAKSDPDAYIVDEPQWVVKPEGFYSKNTFRLAVGSKVKKSIIIADDDDRPDEYFLHQEYTQVIHPPVELRSKFEFDMDANLRDLAGISTTVFTKFISYDKLKRCYSTTLKNPFENPEPVIGLEDGVWLQDFFNLDLVPEWLRRLPLYIHLDIAYSGDGYGIGCVANAGTKVHERVQTGELVSDPIYIAVFSAKIKAPEGDQVSLEKVRQFIYWLKFTQDYNLKRVSTDGFMSADTRQAMITRGIDSDLLSLDRAPCTGYTTFRTAIYEKRFATFECEMLETEILNLERNEMTQKVDHPPDGSKDASDGICGAVYNASLHPEDNNSSISKSIDLMLQVNESTDQKDADMRDLSDQLTGNNRNKSVGESESMNVTDDDDIDTIINKVTGQSNKPKQVISEEMKNYYASIGILI